MYGSIRIRAADRALWLVERAARLARAVIHAIVALPRWRPSDLYAALRGCRWAAAHDLIDQAAALGDDPDARVVAARTWPWWGADVVIKED